MFKSLLRFFLLFILCMLFVYAPEILSSVSGPYALDAPQRSLLRIALNCDAAASAQLQKIFTAYQKQFPAVHLRIAQISEDDLLSMPSPYTDVILCPETLSVQLPSSFTVAVHFPLPHGDHEMLCAVSSSSAAGKTAQEFAAFINEAFSSMPSSPQI